MNMLPIVMLLSFVLLRFDPAMSELTLDTVVLAGDSIVLNCARTYMNWYYVPPYHAGHDNGDKDIYFDGRLKPEFEKQGFRIHGNQTVGEVNLFITNVTVGMAGKYECRKRSEIVDVYQLIVLENVLVCNVTQVSGVRTIQCTGRIPRDECSGLNACSSSHNDSVRTPTNGLTQFIGPNTCDIPHDEILLSCSVMYFGNDTPVLELRNLRENKFIASSCSETEVEANTSRKHLTCNVTMNATIDLDGQQFIWQTNQSAQRQYNCTTEPLRIQYSIDGKTLSHKTIELGDKVNCTANCSHPCGYKWTWSETSGYGGSIYVYCTKELEASRTGSYRCEAMCQIGKHMCEVTVMHVEVIPSPESKRVGEQATVEWKIIVPIVAAIVISVAAGSAVLYILLRRKRRNQTQNQTQAERISLQSHATPVNIRRETR